MIKRKKTIKKTTNKKSRVKDYLKTKLYNASNGNFDFIDVAKFFAMIFVVLLHCIGDNSNVNYKVVQIGCMAFFFFASGFVFKEEYKDYTLMRYIAKNIKSLLIPYFAFAGIGLIICCLFQQWYSHYTFINYMFAIFYMAEPLGSGLVWFLACLFEVRIAFFILWKIISCLENKKAKIVMLILCIVFFYFATIRLKYYYDELLIIRWPLKLDSALIAICYYIFGFLFKYSGAYKCLYDKKRSLIIFAVTRIVATYIEINMLGITNICRFYFEPSIFLYFINQMIMVISYAALGSIFRDVEVFKYLGKNNLFIFLIHAHVIWFISELYGSITGFTRYNYVNWIEIIPISLIAYIITIIVSEGLKRGIDFIKKA